MEPMDFDVLEGERIPVAFRALERPCRRLYARGSLPPAAAPRVAIVGSRAASPGGEQTAYRIAFALARAGVVVVSGLARGIDAAAHRGALDGGGITVAFLGCGVDVVYPRSSRELASEIRRRGAAVSEYPGGTPPRPYHFVERNRLVAAYTAGTLVVEAGPRSGALITAGLAAGMGRELWAVPGDPRRPGCAGSNRLLRDGAAVVLDAQDVLAALGMAAMGGAEGAGVRPPSGLTKSEARVWRTLASHGPVDVETLARTTGLSASTLLEALSLLELGGHAARDGEGYRLVPSRGP